MIPPRPARIPFTIKSLNTPFGKMDAAHTERLVKKESIKSIGYSDHEKIAWKIRNKILIKTTYPKTGCIKISSNHLVKDLFF